MAAPGDMLVDRYELRSRLGRGGMAEVFRAYDHRLSREVAVKVLADDLLADARSVDRFDREARSAASLNHPNIVNVYDAISDGDTHAIVMELMQGPTLADVIERDGPLEPAEAVRIGIGIADALQAAHDRGLVHHDVKPRNVLFDNDGSLKVTDFGIARAASSDITTVQGSPPYLAPEQARGGQSDRRSDIYALGCVLFEMLAGRPPFEGDSSSAVIMAHIDEPVPRLSSLRPGVPRELETIVTRALDKDPDQRFDSPAAMRAALTRVASGLPSDATIVSSTRAMPQDATMTLDDQWHEPPPEPTRPYDDRDRRRRGVSARAIAIALAAILLLVVLAMAWADNQGRQTADPDPVASEEPAEPDQEAAANDDQPDGDQSNQDQGGDGDAEREIDRLNRLTNRLQRLLERGRAADEATQDRIDELQRELEEALEQGPQDGDGDGDLSASEDTRLDQLRERLDQLADNEAISDGVADRIRDLIDEINPFGEG
ncbi:MAG: protein kinase [Actinobacteria bacterium]|nr:protein kinase [Actinomycetota bacterium]